jgi:hypothetical protein
MTSCPAKHIAGGTGAARIGQDRLVMVSKSPQSGKPHKNSFFQCAIVLCFTLLIDLLTVASGIFPHLIS